MARTVTFPLRIARTAAVLTLGGLALVLAAASHGCTALMTLINGKA